MTFSTHKQAWLQYCNKRLLLGSLCPVPVSRLLAFTSVTKTDYFENHSHIKTYRFQPHLWCWYWWCDRGPLLRHWLSLIRQWHCCSLCVSIVTMCGVYFPSTKAAMSIKALVSIFFRSRRFSIRTSKTHLFVWWMVIKCRTSYLAVCLVYLHILL